MKYKYNKRAADKRWNDFTSIGNMMVNASKSFKAANPKLVTFDKHREIELKPVKNSLTYLNLTTGMNKTESLFWYKLLEMHRKGEISRVIYEGLTLRWADMRYTPDFVVFPTFPGALPVMIEVKGGHIYDRDIVRFKGCRAAWPEFGFQLWQYKNKIWKKKY